MPGVDFVFNTNNTCCSSLYVKMKLVGADKIGLTHYVSQ